MRSHHLTRRRALGLLAAGASAFALPPSLAKAAGTPTPILRKGTPAFDTARSGLTWNPRLPNTRVPAAIAQPESAADVAAAIKYARASKLKVAIRGGGHNYHGPVLRDGSLLINLSRLNTLKIDATTQRASVGPGVKSGELITALDPHKLAFPVAHCSDVNLSGYLLNGGYGWNFGLWGPACLSITGMEMVNAAGDILYADESRNADLFWAARGAGPGFFAAVTRFDLKLYPLPAVHTYAASYALSDAAAIAKWLPQALAQMNSGVEVDVLLGPIEQAGQPLLSLIATSFAPTPPAAAKAFAPLRTPPRLKPVGGIVDQAVTFTEAFEPVDATFPAKRMTGDMYFSNAPAADLLLKLVPFAEHMPPAPSAIMLACLGGAKEPDMLKVDGKRASLSSVGRIDFGAYAFWDKPEDDAKNIAWVRKTTDAIAPFKSGCYVGEADLSSSPTRVQECFSPEAWGRLVELRAKHDPAGLFHSYLT